MGVIVKKKCGLLMPQIYTFQDTVCPLWGGHYNVCSFWHVLLWPVMRMHAPHRTSDFVCKSQSFVKCDAAIICDIHVSNGFGLVMDGWIFYCDNWKKSSICSTTSSSRLDWTKMNSKIEIKLNHKYWKKNKKTVLVQLYDWQMIGREVRGKNTTAISAEHCKGGST